jgi:patatin-like phospholipase/acyl hydrolase
VGVFSFSLNDNSPKIWSTFRAKLDPKENIYLKDAANATSAAPTYLEPKKIAGTYHVDGGLFATNPSMMGVAELLHHCDKLTTDDILLVSVGTGKVTGKNFDPEQGAGLYHWLVPSNIITMMMHASTLAADMQAQGIFRHYHHRVQIDIPSQLSKIDDPSKVKELKRFIEDYWNEHPDMLDGVIESITNGDTDNRLRGCLEKLQKSPLDEKSVDAIETDDGNNNYDL